MIDLKGCGTALITPFTPEGTLDEGALRRLVDFQIAGNIDFLVPCGTTGESPTLNEAEHLRVVEIVVEQSKGRVPVMAGAGGNNTAKIIELARKVERLGADAILSVSPYYNKPTQEGIFQHFSAIAESVRIPIVLYNVPGRTSVNILPDTIVRLSKIGNIVGVKEASGNIEQIGELLSKVSVDFKVFSGDDTMTVPVMALGGAGVISVASNEVPAEMSQLARYCLNGDFGSARELNRRLYPLLQINFVETNPGPVKAALAMMGLVTETYRLPIVPLQPQSRIRLQEVLRNHVKLPTR